MSGRQILWTLYQHFHVNVEDRQVTDLKKMRDVHFTNDLQKFKYAWDTTIDALHV